MSLQVWLPLNGNLENQGLSNITITNNGVTVDNNGKIGKCYSFSNGNTLFCADTILSKSQNEYSISVWAKGYGCLYSQRPEVNSIYRCIFIYSQNRILFDEGNRWDASVIYDGNNWNHFVFIKNGSKRYIYINGHLAGENANASTPSQVSTGFFIGDSQNTATSTIGNPFIGKMNDFRIYDHALSVKEIKELSKGLCLHYQLKDEIGVFSKIYDASGYLNNGIIAGSIVNDTDTPRYQRCYKFTPTSYIGIPNQPLNSFLTDFTFCFWMKTSSPKATMCLWNGRNNIGTALGIFALGGTFRYDDGSQRSMTNYSIPINEWHYYVFARDSSNIKFYVDGELKQTVSSSPFSDIGTNATIGASSINTTTGSGNTFSGLLSDYRIYATTLNEKDILELYQASFQIDNNGNSYSYELIEQE